jgi:hypothetical protein
VPNVYKPTFEEGERPEGFRSRRARIGYELPDSDKIGVGERLPKGGGLRAFFKRGDRVGYFDGESLDES